MELRDNFHRIIDYLRISVTDRCNLRCVYCMPAGGVRPAEHKEINKKLDAKRRNRQQVDSAALELSAINGQFIRRFLFQSARLFDKMVVLTFSFDGERP